MQPSTAPEKHRSGFYVAPWALLVVGGVLVLAAGFAIGRLVDHGGRGDGRIFRGPRPVGSPGGARPFGGPGGGGGGHGLWLLVALLVLALVVAAVVLVVRHFSTSHAAAASAPSPAQQPHPAAGAEAMLAERFARGEMDEEEFVRRRNALRG
jgi:putative membrane protein